MFASLKRIYKDEETFRAAIVFSVLVSAICWLLIKTSSVIWPFITAAVIASLLDKYITSLQKRGIPRGAGAFLIVLLIMAVLGCLIAAVSFFVHEYFMYYSGNIKSAVTFLAEWLPLKLRYIADKMHLPVNIDSETIKEYIVGSLGGISEMLAKYVFSIYEHAKSFVGIFSFIFFVPIIVFYMAKDWPRIVTKTREYAPYQIIAFLDFALPRAINSLKQQLKGQVKVASIAFCLYTVCLFFIGLQPFLLLGLISGILTFIPFIGMLVAFAVSFLVVLGQSGSFAQVIAIAIMYFIGSSIESNFLTPRFVGKQIGMHPVWVFFAVLAVISWLGAECALFVMPVATLIWSLVHSTLAWFRDDQAANTVND
jgi:predicted PurR-regulated permease PerM